MNRLLVLLLVFIVSFSAYAVETHKKKDSQVVVKTESQSVFKGLLYKVWGRLRSLNPQLDTSKTRRRGVSTIGIRGSQTTESLIEPYWKGDKTTDPVYVEQLSNYTRAQQLAEDGKLQQAEKALNDFLEEYSDSELVPNAQFALGLTQGGLGETEASIESLEQFIEDNPNHPLVADAKQVIAELK